MCKSMKGNRGRDWTRGMMLLSYVRAIAQILGYVKQKYFEKWKENKQRVIWFN